MTGEDALLFDVTPHHDLRAPARWHGQGRWGAWGYLLPAVVLTAVVLLAPLTVTVVTSVTEDGGLDGYLKVLTDDEVWLALFHNALWLMLALVVCGLGLGLAWLARDTGPRMRWVLLAVLALPSVTSPLTTGVAFRLIFDANPSRGLVSALLPGDVAFLGPGWIWLVLGLAFVWQWTGLAFLVFHVGLSTMPEDLLRVGRVFGAGKLRRLRTVVVPALFPTAALVMLIVLTAAVRVFDLVLVGVPGSIQSSVDVVGLFWWRHRDDLGDGRASALAILLFAMAVALVMLVLWRLRRDWPSAGPRREDRPVPAPGRPRRVIQVLSAVVAVVWAFPLVALLLTSFRAPVEAATSGWWTGGYGLGSYGEAFSDGSFASALGATAQRGLLVAVVVLLLAVPAAYALTPEQLPRRARRIVATGAVVLTVLPPQALALPLGKVLGPGPGGIMILSFVHAALVLPLAVLLLRNAFTSVPRPVVLRPLAEGRSAMFQVTAESGPAVVAVAVLAFVLTWNDLVLGLLLNWPADQAPLVVLQQARHFTTSAGGLAAQTIVLTAVPVLLLFATGRWLVRGLTQGVRR
ncbi:alpha-glucoside transport system permease protein [Streptosporangium subroseum]|uniref:Alpha-glucoside transport system permease protein n=1 Tax=Streptosporangium subroseum TaxID=106412 RepID=A0A239NRP2_9ACTN|nr:ABC transporter permease subunit [Streptosporangium subroseum]SNT57591.1 alpha-glucoside transport system permease protein [Streptosporangium subroseum]